MVSWLSKTSSYGPARLSEWLDPAAGTEDPGTTRTSSRLWHWRSHPSHVRRCAACGTRFPLSGPAPYGRGRLDSSEMDTDREQAPGQALRDHSRRPKAACPGRSPVEHGNGGCGPNSAARIA